MATFSSGLTQVADPVSKSLPQETSYKWPSAQVRLFFFKGFHFCVLKYRDVRYRYEGISGHSQSGKIEEVLNLSGQREVAFSLVGEPAGGMEKNVELGLEPWLL